MILGNEGIKASLIRDVANWAKNPDNRYMIVPHDGGIGVERVSDGKIVFNTYGCLFLSNLAKADEYYTDSYMYSCFNFDVV